MTFLVKHTRYLIWMKLACHSMLHTSRWSHKKNPTAPSSGDKAQITMVACVSAAGSFMPSMVILDRKTLPPRFTEGEVPGTAYGMSAKGWIDQELFDGWFGTHFFEVCSTSLSFAIAVGWTLKPQLSRHHKAGCKGKGNHFCPSSQHHPPT